MFFVFPSSPLSCRFSIFSLPHIARTDQNEAVENIENKMVMVMAMLRRVNDSSDSLQRYAGTHRMKFSVSPLLQYAMLELRIRNIRGRASSDRLGK